MSSKLKGYAGTEDRYFCRQEHQKYVDIDYLGSLRKNSEF